MTKPAEIAAMIKTAEKTLGSLDILVNNAGIQHVAPIEEFPIEKWDADHRASTCPPRSMPCAPPCPA